MKENIIEKIKVFRYERKFPIEGIFGDEILLMIKNHPAGFREIYYERDVNSIYFDTFHLSHYLEGLNGVDPRLKVRIRWYGNLFDNIPEPHLEFKYRQNDLIGKVQYPLKPFKLDHNFSIHNIRKIFKESKLDEFVYQYMVALNLSAVTRYQRRYFLSFDRKYRMTFDKRLMTYKLSNHQNNFLNCHKNSGYFILELKYDTPWDDYADEIVNAFPLRISKCSKYMRAVNPLGQFA